MKREIVLVVTSLLTGLGLIESNQPEQTPVKIEPVVTNVSHTTPLCPVVGDGRTSDYKIQAEQFDSNGEPVVMEYIHCRKCEVGALFPLIDTPTTGRCSFCHEEFPDTFKE